MKYIAEVTCWDGELYMAGQVYEFDVPPRNTHLIPLDEWDHVTGGRKPKRKPGRPPKVETESIEAEEV